MKIIGHTSSRLLVEMDTDEFAKAAGYSSTYDEKFRKAFRDKTYPVVGTVAEVRAAYDFHQRIALNETKAKEAASTFRALAALLDGAMPSVILPPVEANDEVQP